MQPLNDRPAARPRGALSALLLALAAAAAATACTAPSDIIHRVSVDVGADPADLRACVIEATRGVDGLLGVDAPAGGVESSLVSFRTTLRGVSGEVERVDGGLRVSIEVNQHVEPDGFWDFAQPRAKAVGDAIVAKCGAL